MKIKDHFTSRWGKDGVLIEADWSQLECVGWAFLTKDPMMYKLLNEGIDIHRMIGSMLHKCRPEEITDEQRKAIKPATFLFIYGGSAWELARVHGMEQDFADRLYEAFWTLFPTARLWQDNVCASVNASSYLINEYTPLGQQRREGHYKSITGRIYTFKTYDESAYQRNRGNLTKFKRSEMVNYPIQGFCTADLHLIAIGNLFRKSLIHRDKYLLINTIHDSVLLDCKKEFIDWTCNYVKDVLECTKEHLKTIFNIEFDLPLKVELKVGKSWSKMEKYII